MCPRDPIDIGEAARRIGVTPATLRLYEARGLIRSARSANGYRQYSPEVMRAPRRVVDPPDRRGTAPGTRRTARAAAPAPGLPGTGAAQVPTHAAPPRAV